LGTGADPLRESHPNYHGRKGEGKTVKGKTPNNLFKKKLLPSGLCAIPFARRSFSRQVWKVGGNGGKGGGTFPHAIAILFGITKQLFIRVHEKDREGREGKKAQFFKILLKLEMEAKGNSCERGPITKGK